MKTTVPLLLSLPLSLARTPFLSRRFSPRLSRCCSFLPPSRSPTTAADSIPGAPWSPAPVSTARAPLFFQVLFLPSPSGPPGSLVLSLPLPALFPSRPRPLLPAASTYPSSGSRLLLVSFSLCAELVFLPARRQVRGCSRMGRMEGRGTVDEDEREDEAEALSRLKGADATYGSRPDCTQLFRRAILMPWTPSTNHPFLSLPSS